MKIGITTHYFRSDNYGGNLQAYAMCKVLEKLGHNAEQICFPFQTYTGQKTRLIIAIKVFVADKLDLLLHLWNRIQYFRRKRAMLAFNTNLIPHSRKVYSLKSLPQVENKYNLFITGSDIVWGPYVHSPFFFLNFLSSSAKKLSYAASLGTDKLTDSQKQFFKSDLASYIAVSVRERAVVPILEEAIGRSVDHCLDPTLLLNAEDWDKICTPCIISEPYIFCYFLGNNPQAVSCVRSYANQHGLKVVNIPCLSPHYVKTNDFGDIRLSNVSPSDFISLIKYADCVMTDSFHACVFSSIYKKNFFAFRRSHSDDLGVRLLDFMSILGLKSHYCNDAAKECVEYLNSISKAEYSDSTQIQDIINHSYDYLSTSLIKAETV